MRRMILLLACLLALLLQCSPTAPPPPGLNLDAWECYTTAFHTPFPTGKSMVKLRLPSGHFNATATYNVVVNGVAP